MGLPFYRSLTSYCSLICHTWQISLEDSVRKNRLLTTRLVSIYLFSRVLIARMKLLLLLFLLVFCGAESARMLKRAGGQWKFKCEKSKCKPVPKAKSKMQHGNFYDSQKQCLNYCGLWQ
ncbi:unnamed protein product [Cylicocyclus nassatus]|uniref:Uncharacterized protein n=1 Tax=Cylicocyclus nassatus TaxID=53992 RepID=A0AA36DJY1_CYLNA|nr:unnamed protein product [Cylicocyclus nassatus]